MAHIRLNINLPQELHKMLKVQATLRDESITNYVIDAVKTKLIAEKKRYKLPNKETLDALEASDQNNTTSYDYLEDLYEKLDI